ncbi:hypothetical protein LguiB_019232 [Lonicera macranthoides]
MGGFTDMLRGKAKSNDNTSLIIFHTTLEHMMKEFLMYNLFRFMPHMSSSHKSIHLLLLLDLIPLLDGIHAHIRTPPQTVGLCTGNQCSKNWFSSAINRRFIGNRQGADRIMHDRFKISAVEKSAIYRQFIADKSR